MEENYQYITRPEWRHIKAGETVDTGYPSETITAPPLNGPYTLYQMADENNCHAGWYWEAEEETESDRDKIIKEYLPESSLRRNFKIKQKFKELLKISKERYTVFKHQGVIEDVMDELSEDDEYPVFYQIWDGNDLLGNFIENFVSVYDKDLFEDFYRIWSASIDKELVEAFFYRLSGMNLEAFLEHCEGKMCCKEQKERIEKIEDLYRRVKNERT